MLLVQLVKIIIQISMSVSEHTSGTMTDNGLEETASLGGGSKYFIWSVKFDNGLQKNSVFLYYIIQFLLLKG